MPLPTSSAKLPGMIKLDFDKQGGLVPVIVQDAEDGAVLMLAYMNELAFRTTVDTGKATYWSRSRKELWIKGETSGKTQEVREIFIDCDTDTVLLKVRQIGDAACHEGYRSCFFRKVDGDEIQVQGERVFDPAEVYKK